MMGCIWDLSESWNGDTILDLEYSPLCQLDMIIYFPFHLLLSSTILFPF